MTESKDKGSYALYPSPDELKQSTDAETTPLYQQQPTSPSAPLQYYGTFQGNPTYPQPAPPGFSYPENQQYSQTVQGYPVLEGAPSESQYQQYQQRLPCCGIGVGWFLFIIGWFLGTIPWYIGAILLMCTRPDYRERVGLVCCTVGAVLSLIAIIVGGTQATG